MNCCVCDKPIRHDQKFALSEHRTAVVHDPECTYLVPHRFLPVPTCEHEVRHGFCNADPACNE